MNFTDRRTRSTYRLIGTSLLAVMLAFISFKTSPASAQPAPPDEAATQTQVTGQQLLSDMLLRVTMQTLIDSRGDNTGLREDQLVRAQVLLDLALELTPDDAELWSKRISLAEQASDTPGVLSALRRYVELQPEHDAYRLRLTLTELAEVETLDGRLAILEEALRDASSRGYSEAYRSRLASAAATIAREVGDNNAFLKHLKTAVRDDPANGEAAGLTYDLALERGAKPLNLGAAAINLVHARPLDSDARLLLADALYNLGVYDRAVRQFEVAAGLPRATPIPPAMWAKWSSCLIASGQTLAAENYLNQIQQQLALPIEEGGSATTLPIELELQRRVLHGNTEPGKAALTRVVDQLQTLINDGDEEAKLEIAWIIALFGDDTQPVAALLEGQDRNDPRYLRATGFVFMREGAERWARHAFEQIAQTDDIAAYGLALLLGRDDAGRARSVRGVVQDMPGTFGGLLAANQLHELRRDVMPGPQGQAIIDAMNRLPITLWRFDIDRNPWVTMRAQFDSSRSGFLEPIDAKLIVQNALDVPLPIDPSVGLGNQAFVSMSAFTNGQSLGQLPPLVVDMAGRLTLGPRERLETPVRIDRSIFGLLLNSATNTTLTYNTTFTTDPRFLPNGVLVPGPLGAIDTVRSLQAFVPALDVENFETWINDAMNGQGLPRWVALNRLARTGDTVANAEGIDRDVSRRSIEALTAAFENSGPVEQAWILLLLASTPGQRTAFQSILDQGQRSDADLVRIAYLIAHVNQPDDNALTTAIRDGSPAVQRFARGLSDFLSLPPVPTP